MMILAMTLIFISTSLHAGWNTLRQIQIQGNKTTVPEVTGKPLHTAKEILKRSGLPFEVINEGRTLSSEENELVTKQEPKANNPVTQDTKVKLWLSKEAGQDVQAKKSIPSTLIKVLESSPQHIALSGPDRVRHGTLFQLQWTPIRQIQEYELHMSRDRNFAYFETQRVIEARRAFLQSASEDDSHVYFRVRAIFTDGNPGMWSNIKDVTITAMEAPQLSINRTSVNSDQLYTMNWSVVQGATYYYVQRSPQPSFPRDQTFSYQVVPNSDQQHHEVHQRTIYYYRVQARQDLNKGRWSNAVSVAIEPGRSATSETLAAPRLSTSATSVYGGNAFQLSWSNIPGAVQYDFQSADNLEFRQGALSSLQSTQTTSRINIRNFQDRGVTYYHHVRARNEQGPGAWSNIVSVSINPLPAPLLTVNSNQAQSDQTYTISWSQIEQAREYIVEESTAPTFSSANVRLYTVSSTTLPAHNTVSQNMLYYYRVRGDNSQSGGRFSNIVTVAVSPSRGTASTLPAPTLSVNPTRVISNEAFELGWNRITEARNYDVEESSDSTFSRPSTFETELLRSSMRINLSISRQSTTHYYRVRARNDHGSGPWSNIIQVFIEYRE